MKYAFVERVKKYFVIRRIGQRCGDGKGRGMIHEIRTKLRHAVRSIKVVCK